MLAFHVSHRKVGGDVMEQIPVGFEEEVAQFSNWSLAEVAIHNFSINATASADHGGPATKPIFTLLLFVNAASILTNIWVISRCIHTEKLHRATCILLANLAGVSICIAVINTCCPGEKALLFVIAGPLCTIIPYWKSVLLTALPVNLVAVIHVRVSHFREHKASGRAFAMVFCIWTISIVFNVPVFDMARPRSGLLGSDERDGDSKNVGTYLENCERINLMGSPIATSVYELVRLLLFHVLVILYMLYAVARIGMKLWYLCRTTANAPNQRLKRKIRSISLAIFHVVSLAFLWLPLGLFLLHRRVVGRQIVGESAPELARDYRGAYGSLFALLYIYIQVTPLLSLKLLLSTPNTNVNRKCVAALPTYFGHCVAACCTHRIICKRRRGAQCGADLGAVTSRDTKTRPACKQNGDTSRFSTFEISNECSKFGSKCEPECVANLVNGLEMKTLE